MAPKLEHSEQLSVIATNGGAFRRKMYTYELAHVNTVMLIKELYVPQAFFGALRSHRSFIEPLQSRNEEDSSRFWF